MTLDHSTGAHLYTRHDSVKLGDIETRVAHEAVPSKHDAQLLSHLTSDLKQDTRCITRSCCSFLSLVRVI